MKLRDFDKGLRWSAILGWLIMPPFAWHMRMIARLTTRQRPRRFSIKGARREEVLVARSQGGGATRVCVYKPLTTDHLLPVLLYLHPGGYVIGAPEDFERIIGEFMATRECVVVVPDYRKALTAPYPAAINDCYDTLLWIRDNAAELGIRSDQIMVGGHSAGGGLTAAVSLRARDRGEVKIAFQMPIYPMIDDRMEGASARKNNGPLWGSRSNALGWGFYLRGLRQQGQPTPYDAAPARATDYSGLPPTMTYVGDLEPFRDETIAFVENLKKAGVPVDFALFKGCYHGFDVFAPNAAISKQARAFAMICFAQAIDNTFAPQA
jgi:acetyl esterase/lipase